MRKPSDERKKSLEKMQCLNKCDVPGNMCSNECAASSIFFCFFWFFSSVRHFVLSENTKALEFFAQFFCVLFQWLNCI